MQGKEPSRDFLRVEILLNTHSVYVSESEGGGCKHWLNSNLVLRSTSLIRIYSETLFYSISRNILLLVSIIYNSILPGIFY